MLIKDFHTSFSEIDGISSQKINKEMEDLKISFSNLILLIFIEHSIPQQNIVKCIFITTLYFEPLNEIQ